MGDDCRPQKSWELRKAWIEEPSRSFAARTCIEDLAKQQHFVRKRGSISKLFYFEVWNPKSNAIVPRASHLRSAIELSDTLEKALKAALRTIPFNAICDDMSPIRIPGRLFLQPGSDYEPLRFVTNPEALPPWLHCNPED